MLFKVTERNISTIVAWWLTALFFGIILLYAPQTITMQQFVDLADAFLSGQLHLKASPHELIPLDYVFLGDRAYWPEAPFAAVALMPLVYLLGPSSLVQSLAHVAVLVGIFYVVYRLARRYHFEHSSSLWIAFAFCFASVTFGLAFIAFSFYFAQMLSVLLLLLALLEFHGKQRWFLIGILVALAVATRYTLVVSVLFFILYIIVNRSNGVVGFQKKLHNSALFLLPNALVIAVLLLYNYARFDTFFGTGYGLASVGSNNLFLFEKYGLFKLQNIPSNFYYYFIRMPQPFFDGASLHLISPYLMNDLIGMSFFVVSPIFLYIFKTPPSLKKQPPFINLLWLVSAAQLVLLLSYYSPGANQFGARYMLDLMPWLLLLLFFSLGPKALSKNVKVLITFSAFFNYFLLLQAI